MRFNNELFIFAIVLVYCNRLLFLQRKQSSTEDEVDEELDCEEGESEEDDDDYSYTETETETTETESEEEDELKSNQLDHFVYENVFY